MQTRNAITLSVGLVLSIALHWAVLRGKMISSPPKPILKQGRTVVRLTLKPSPSIPKKQPPAPIQKIEKPAVPKTVVEPITKKPSPVKPKPEKKLAKPIQPAKPNPSVPQDASLIPEKGVTADAQVAQESSPVYPRLSRRRGEEGTVVLSVQVTDEGIVSQAIIRQSSGFRRLDDAALAAAKQTKFAPAKRRGKCVESATELSFTFQLTKE